ncbi:MAG: methyl-accepting chemotaxis protein [Desulfuromonadales bacterium]|nr:methyl-accepting chemotaxis protein [Desulfuromonadales bacterium]
MKVISPAKRLMNRLPYSRKMLVAGLFFCIPITLLAFFLISNIREQMAFSYKEVSGVQYAAALDNLLDGVLEVRDSGTAGTRIARITPEQALIDLEKVEEHLGGELATKERFALLKSKLSALGKEQGSSGRQRLEAYGPLSADILEMIVLVSDNSNLTLDPDIDSYYLMDSLITKLPPLAEAISRANMISLRLSGANGTADDKTNLIILSSQIRAYVEALKKNVQSTEGANTALGARLHKPLQEVDAAVSAFLTDLKKVTTGSASATRGNSSAAMDARNAVFRAAAQFSPELDQLLKVRIGKLRSRMTTYLAISLLAFLLGIYLNIGCYLSVREGISSLRDAAIKVADGDLTAEALFLSHDEIGETARMFNTMTENLRQIIATVSNVTGTVHSFTGTLSSSVESQAGFSTQLSSSVVEISATMEEFSSTASQIAQHSQVVVERADRTLDDTRRGAGEVEALALKINHINNDIQASLAEIVELGRKSKEINKVMAIINNIANQTRLIAFNAALEAASAGESGKRFGVVALEIRRLADSVVESTGEIEGRITEILDSVNRLVMSSEKSSLLTREGQEYASSTVAMLSEIVDGVEETTDSARQISLSTQQQQIASGQVVLALRDIEQGVRYSTESIQKVNSVSSELAQLSENLRELVDRFKLGAEPENRAQIASAEAG